MMDYIVFGLLLIGVVFSLLRIIKGPSVFNRVVGLDTLNMIVVGLLALIAYIDKNGLYLDIAIVYGILSFLETVIIVRFLEGRK